MKSMLPTPTLARAAARLLTLLSVLALGPVTQAALKSTPETHPNLTSIVSGSIRPTIPFHVFIPTDYNPNTSYPVVIYLHGKGGSYTGDSNQASIRNNYNTAANAGLVRPVIMVIPDAYTYSGVPTGWSDSKPGFTGTPNIPNETDVWQIIDYVDTTYNTLGDAGRAIIGHSMGGSGSAKFATKYPDKFVAWVGYDAPLNTWADLDTVSHDHYGNDENYFDLAGNPWFWISGSTNIANIIVNGTRYRQVKASSVGAANVDFRNELVAAGITDFGVGTNEEYIDVGVPHSPASGIFNADGTRSWEFLEEVFAGTGGGGPTTVPFNGLAEDGWVLESTETSGAGGSNNGGGQNLLVGDNTTRQQYRAILSFDTSDLPDGAVITGATLKLTRTGGAGSVASLGSLQAAIKTGTFGAAGIENGDFSAAPTTGGVASFNIPAVNGDLAIGPLTSGLGAINKTGKTQFRLAFTIDDDNDGNVDRIDFGSGNNTANLPVLEVTYE